VQAPQPLANIRNDDVGGRDCLFLCSKRAQMPAHGMHDDRSWKARGAERLQDLVN
jgi:hypothetical protein